MPPSPWLSDEKSAQEQAKLKKKAEKAGQRRLRQEKLDQFFRKGDFILDSFLFCVIFLAPAAILGFLCIWWHETLFWLAIGFCGPFAIWLVLFAVVLFFLTLYTLVDEMRKDWRIACQAALEKVKEEQDARGKE